MDKRRQDKEDEELKSCTFIPKINQTRPKPKAPIVVSLGNMDDSFKEPLLLKDALREEPLPDTTKESQDAVFQ